MDTDIDAHGDLTRRLEQVIDFLDVYGFASSTALLREYTDRLRSGDESAIEPLLLLFPGMGGLGDIVINAKDGRPLSDDEWQCENRELQERLNSIYRSLQALADTLRETPH